VILDVLDGLYIGDAVVQIILVLPPITCFIIRLRVGIVVVVGGVMIGFVVVVIVVVVGLGIVKFDGTLGNEGSFHSGAFVNDLFKGRCAKNL